MMSRENLVSSWDKRAPHAATVVQQKHVSGVHGRRPPHPAMVQPSKVDCSQDQFGVPKLPPHPATSTQRCKPPIVVPETSPSPAELPRMLVHTRRGRDWLSRPSVLPSERPRSLGHERTVQRLSVAQMTSSSSATVTKTQLFELKGQTPNDFRKFLENDAKDCGLSANCDGEASTAVSLINWAKAKFQNPIPAFNARESWEDCKVDEGAMLAKAKAFDARDVQDADWVKDFGRLGTIVKELNAGNCDDVAAYVFCTVIGALPNVTVCLNQTGDTHSWVTVVGKDNKVVVIDIWTGSVSVEEFSKMKTLRKQALVNETMKMRIHRFVSDRILNLLTDYKKLPANGKNCARTSDAQGKRS